MTKIVAVSACIAGLAHTMMAKAALEKAAKALGVEIKVETQGVIGIDNRLDEEEIEAADVVIFAVDTNVDERERFDGKNIYTVGTSEAVRDAEAVIKAALAQD